MRANQCVLYVSLALLQPASGPVTLVQFLVKVPTPAPPEAGWMQSCSDQHRGTVVTSVGYFHSGSDDYQWWEKHHYGKVGNSALGSGTQVPETFQLGLQTYQVDLSGTSHSIMCIVFWNWVTHRGILRRVSIQVSDTAHWRTSDTSMSGFSCLSVSSGMLYLASSGIQKMTDCPLPSFLILIHAWYQSVYILERLWLLVPTHPKAIMRRRPKWLKHRSWTSEEEDSNKIRMIRKLNVHSPCTNFQLTWNRSDASLIRSSMVWANLSLLRCHVLFSDLSSHSVAQPGWLLEE